MNEELRNSSINWIFLYKVVARYIYSDFASFLSSQRTQLTRTMIMNTSKLEKKVASNKYHRAKGWLAINIIEQKDTDFDAIYVKQELN